MFAECPTTASSGHAIGPRATVAPCTPREPLSAATLVKWAHLPHLAPDACTEFQTRLTETELRYDSKERQANAAWLQKLVAMKCVTWKEIAAALSQEHPFLALERLKVQATAALTAHLEALTQTHALGIPKGWQANVSIDLAEIQSTEAPMLLILFEGYYAIEIDSLHKAPVRIARLVYRCLQLLSETVLPAMLPHDVWASEFTWNRESYRDAYDCVIRAGGGADLARAVECVRDHNLEEWLSPEPETLKRQLEVRWCQFHGLPSWMKDHSCRSPLRGARQLVRLAGQYEIESGPHPWLDYVRYVSASILERFATDAACRRSLKRRHHHNDLNSEDLAPLHVALWVTSGTAVEEDTASRLYRDLPEAGEALAARHVLQSMSPVTFRDIVESLALGLGLLLRAGAVNRECSKPQRVGSCR